MEAVLTAQEQAQQLMTVVFEQIQSFVWKPIHMCEKSREQHEHRKTTDTACCRVKKRDGMEDTVEESTDVPHRTCKRATQGWEKKR